MQKFIALLVLATITSGCSNMQQFQDAYQENTRSRLVGTWEGKGSCKTSSFKGEQHVILNMKPDLVPFVAIGQVYSMAEVSKGKRELVIANVTGNASLNDTFAIDGKNVRNVSGTWFFSGWKGTVTPDGNLMSMNTCGTTFDLKRIAPAFTEEPLALYPYKTYR